MGEGAGVGVWAAFTAEEIGPRRRANRHQTRKNAQLLGECLPFVYRRLPLTGRRTPFFV